MAQRTVAEGVAAAAAGLRAQIAAQPSTDTGVNAPAAPASGEAPPAAAPQTPRNEKGQFQKQEPAPVPAAPVVPVAPPEDQHKAAMREVIKKQAARLKELEAAAKKPGPMDPSAPPPVDRRKVLLDGMDEGTRKWYETAGRELMRLEVEEIVAPLKGRIDPILTEKAEQDTFDRDFDDWMADRLAEGEIVDQRAMLTGLQHFEAQGWTLGKTPGAHMDAVWAFVKAQKPGASAPVVTGKAADDAAKKAAQAAARSGGVPPGGTVPPAPAVGADYGKKLREASLRGDYNEVQRLMREKRKGTTLDRVFNPNAQAVSEGA